MLLLTAVTFSNLYIHACGWFWGQFENNSGQQAVTRRNIFV
jgi:hypothetical protein